jgi:MHS family proline/betaine transporter-like MFS transporter
MDMVKSERAHARAALIWTDADHRKARRAALAGGLGCLIEYYDFSLYGYLAVVMAPLFFPNKDPVVSLLSALAVFGTAYLIRPLGGLFFGYVGDKYGRKTSLVAVIVSTVLLVLVRLVQGFSAGGQVGGSATFISEAAPAHLKATYGAYTPLGSTMGFAVAAAVAATVSAFTTHAEMQSWGWRIPYLLAFVLTVFCLWARHRVDETYVPAEGGAQPPHSPVGLIFRRHPKALAQATAISAATNGTAYIGLTYMSIHLQRLGYERASVYWVATVVIGIAALCMPFGGRLGDRIGLHRLMTLGLGGYILLTYPMMAVMKNGLAVAAIAFLVIMMNTVATQVSAYTLLPRLFDRRSRFSGVAMGWNLGVILAGGTAPYLAVWLIERTGNILAPAFFVMGVSMIGLIALISVRRQFAELP